MNRKWLSGLIGLAACTVGMSTAQAQAAQPVELLGEVKVDQVSKVDGLEKHAWVEPKTVVPGNRLWFTTRYHNTGKDKVDNFVVTNPIPAGVMLASEGAEGLDLSVDGGKTWGKLAVLKVANGKGGLRPAQASDVSHVRWILPSVAPGATGTLSYNAIVR